ncbi:ROK family protein [Plantibacter sp. Mn2098]|uniref:ROK family protein n=1 Tax=Plantibacter sp. Mn2098 TaxID=3395266 RepID=UPI003BE2BC46
MIDLQRIPVSSPAGVAVFRTVLGHGPIARVDIARRTGLSQAAVTKAVTPLLAAGYLAESGGGRQENVVGRPVNPLVVRSERANIVGVKITADRIYGVLTDLTAGTIAAASAVSASLSVEDVVDTITALVDELAQAVPAAEIAGVGVSASGDVDSAHGVVRDSPRTTWHHVPLQALLEERLDLPVVVDNDVRALARAEQVFGLGVGSSSFALVTIGSGIGCGLYVNGDLVEGANGVSGEIGHLPLASGGLVCSCGRRGCVETVASSSAILERVRRGTGRPDLTLAEAFALAHAGDEVATAAFAAAGDVIGAALAVLVNLIGPEMVIIAGEGVAEFDLYSDRIRRTFAEHAFGAAADCEIVLRSHTFDDWARGAAVSVIRQIASGGRADRTDES